MNDFLILSKIGKFVDLKNCFIGEGAYSEVYKVKRMSD